MEIKFCKNDTYKVLLTANEAQVCAQQIIDSFPKSYVITHSATLRELLVLEVYQKNFNKVIFKEKTLITFSLAQGVAFFQRYANMPNDTIIHHIAYNLGSLIAQTQNSKE